MVDREHGHVVRHEAHQAPQVFAVHHAPAVCRPSSEKYALQRSSASSRSAPVRWSFHEAAWSSGSESLFDRIQASQPISLTHSSGRSFGASTSRTTQLTSSVAQPPPASRFEASRTTRSDSSSTGSSPSRYTQRVSGDTTNGALHVMSPNSSPATGANRLP